MTPAPPQPALPRARIRTIWAALLGVLLLAALFLPARGPVAHGVTMEWRPSAELAGVLFLIAMAALASPRLVAGRGLARDSSGLWSASAAAALLFAAVSLVIAGAYWIWRRVLATLADRRIAIGAAVLLGVALDVTSFLPAERRPLATGLGTDIVRHAAAFERGWRAEAEAGVPLPAALASSGPPGSNLTGLKRRDVYLVYIESYGTTVFDTPQFRSALRGPLIDFESALREAGYTMASNRLVSPTFGGGSWLAHATLASGVPMNDPVLFSQLYRSGRKLLPGYFKDAGWRAIEIMPGIKAPEA